MAYLTDYATFCPHVAGAETIQRGALLNFTRAQGLLNCNTLAVAFNVYTVDVCYAALSIWWACLCYFS